MLVELLQLAMVCLLSLFSLHKRNKRYTISFFSNLLFLIALESLFDINVAQRVPHWRVPVPESSTVSKTFVSQGSTVHVSKLAGNVAFAYSGEWCVCDLEQPLPSTWFACFARSDYWRGRSVVLNGVEDISQPPLLHAIVDSVYEKLGKYCTGPVDAITTLKSFGHTNNPISIYLLWKNDSRKQLDAVALEVTRYNYNLRFFFWFC